MNRNYAKLNDNQIKFAPSYLIVDGNLITNPSEQTYLANGWKKYVDIKPEYKEGYYYVQDGYEQTDTEIKVLYKYVENPKVYRKFSKLKIYGAISMLDVQNSIATWSKVQTWLESKTVNGVNGWMAFQLAQEISEDHPLFEAWSEEARILLGLSTEQFETLLNQCVLEG